MTKTRTTRGERFLFIETIAPKRPAKGKCVLFFDKVANKMKVIKPNGTVVSLEG